MEHQLMALIHCIDGLDSCSVICREKRHRRRHRGKMASPAAVPFKGALMWFLTLGVQPSAITSPSLQRNGITQEIEELFEALAAHLCNNHTAAYLSELSH